MGKASLKDITAPGYVKRAVMSYLRTVFILFISGARRYTGDSELVDVKQCKRCVNGVNGVNGVNTCNTDTALSSLAV